MAKEKIFHVVRKSDQSEHLVRAAKESGVLLILAGNAWTASIATQHDITDHYTAGRKLHPASVAADTKGAKLVRLLPAEGSTREPILIRAKNPAAAIEALTDGDIEIKLADQETLVRLLEAGTKVLEAPQPEPKTNSNPADPSANGGDAPAGEAGAIGAGDDAANDGQDSLEQKPDAA